MRLNEEKLVAQEYSGHMSLVWKNAPAKAEKRNQSGLLPRDRAA